MNKRLGTLIAGLCLVAFAEVTMGAIPAPAPKSPPAPCPSWKRCPPPPPTQNCGILVPCRQSKPQSGFSGR